MAFDLLEPDEDGRFVFAITDEVSVTFHRDDDGAVVMLQIHQGGADFEVPRAGTALAAEQAKKVVVDVEAVQRLLGFYEVGESGTAVEVILEDVWELAAISRLTVKSIKSEKPVPAAGYMEQPLKVAMEGRFEGFYSFLLALEGLPRITRIHEMKLERKSGGRKGKGNEDDSGGVMTAEFVLSIYFEPTVSDNE